MFYSLIYNYVFLPSFMASLVVLLILLTKQLLKKKLTAEWHYYIWFLLLLKLIVPYNLQANFSIYNYVNVPILNTTQGIMPKYTVTNIKTIDTSSSNNTNYVAKTSIIKDTTKSNNAPYVSFVPALSIIWILGISIILIYVLIVNLRTYMYMKTRPLYKNGRLERVLKQCKSEMNIKSAIPIYTANRFPTVPSLCGILKPKILIPSFLESKLTDSDLKYIIFHELAHYKRKDNLLNILLVTLKIINWFNPIIWYGFFMMGEDCEIACDSMALRHLNRNEKSEYGKTLISLYSLTCSQKNILGVNTLFKNKAYIKRRINMIGLFKRKSTILSIIVVVFIIVIGILFTTTNKSIFTGSNKTALNSPAIKVASSQKNEVNNTSTTQNAAITSNTASSVTTSNVAGSDNRNTNSSSTTPATKQVQTTPATKQNTAAQANSNQVQAAQQNQPSAPATSQLYINRNFGLSITFPASWNGKYAISEDNAGINVCYKPASHPAEGSGLLFTIKKKTPDLNEDFLDTVGKRNVTNSKGVTFVIGGPTDVGFPPDNPEFSTYKQLTQERSAVVDTIKSAD